MNEQEILARIDDVQRRIAEWQARRTSSPADEAIVNPTLVALGNELANLQAALSAARSP